MKKEDIEKKPILSMDELKARAEIIRPMILAWEEDNNIDICNNEVAMAISQRIMILGHQKYDKYMFDLDEAEITTILADIKIELETGQHDEWKVSRPNEPTV